MKHTVRLFEISRDAGPGDRPKEVQGFDVRANTIDGAKEAAVAHLRQAGRGIRAISFLADGGLAVIAYPVAERPNDSLTMLESTVVKRGMPGPRKKRQPVKAPTARRTVPQGKPAG